MRFKSALAALVAGAAMMAGFSSFGEENLFTGSTKGSWFVDGNWSLGRVPTAEDDVVISGKAVNAAGSIVANSLTISGTAGILYLGSDTERPNVTATIGENLSVAGGAKLYVYAGRLPDYVTKYEAGKDAFHAAIYENANVVQVGGSFTVGASSFVYPDNDVLTGTPVFFKVGGDFTLEEGATVSADGRGWSWVDAGTATIPSGAYSGTRKVNSSTTITCYSLATGAGTSYSHGGSYGGKGTGSSAKAPYGIDCAPYLSGSPGGPYKTSDKLSRAGGSICLFVSGTAALAGTLTSKALAEGYGRGSGGSIWVVAKSIEGGSALVVTASGCNSSNAAYMPGGGGRVAFEAGVTPDHIAAFVAGERPEGLTYENLNMDGLSVAGGVNTKTTGKDASPGTAVNVYSVAQKTALTIAGSPFNAASEGVVYGTQGVDYGEVSYSVTDYGADAEDPANVRYTCVGYVVSNATREIAHEAGTTAAFTLVNGEGPYTLVWLWGKRETKMKVFVPDAALGTVEVNGETLDEDAELWFGEAATVSLEAVPVDGCAFNCWVGDVDAAQMRHAEIEVVADVSRSLRPMLYVKGEASDRYWVSGKTGLYYSAENWEGGVVPAPQDRVFVTNGTCTARDVLEASALTVGGKGTVVVSDVADVRIAVDLTLSGSGKLTVNAVPLAGERTMATGSTVVWIGGSLLIRDEAVLRPVSDAWTGGSALFNVKGGFVLEEGATIDGATAGWDWVAYEGAKSPEALATSNGYQTKALGRGDYYTVGASYGGKGGYVNGTPQDPYGEANAPIYPGSPTGIYKTNPSVAGGGLVRIHAGGRATVNGTIDVCGGTQSGSMYGGSSGGGIWLTADVCAFGSSARLLANGGNSDYNSTGAGGRIAIGCGLTPRHLADLARTGKCSRHAKGRDLFEAKYPGTAVEVNPGVYKTGNAEEGSFVYYPASGLMILIKGDGAEDPKPAGYPWQGVGEEPSGEPEQPSEQPPSDEPTPENPPEEGQVPALPRVAGLSDAEQGLYEKVVAAFDAVNPIDEATGGRKYISFGFITDEHSCKRVEGDDAATDPVKDYWYYGGASLTKCDHSIRLLGAVSGKVGLDAVFNGGDFATGNSIVGLTDEEYLGQIAYVKGLFAQYLPTTPFFTVDGNHDRNYPAGTVNGQSVPGHVWNDAQWRTALELFNSDVSQNAAVQVTMHRDLAHPTVGSENPGTYVGNSYHVDCTRLMAAGKPNVRFVCVSEYDSTPGNGKLLRMYDGFQFYDPVTQELIDPAKTPENTLVCIISHGNMGTALDQAASGYLNAGSRKGASTQQAQLNSNLGAHKGLGFIGSVAGHAHQTLVKPIDEDGVRKSSCVQVKECYAGHSSTSASGYRFSLFTVDTDLKKLHETRVVDGKAVNYSTEIDMK